MYLQNTKLPKIDLLQMQVHFHQEQFSTSLLSIHSHTIIGCFLQYARFHRDTIIHGGICVYTQVIEHIHIAIGMPHTGNCITSQSYSSWWPGLKHNTIYHQTQHYIPSNTTQYYQTHYYTIKHEMNGWMKQSILWHLRWD